MNKILRLAVISMAGLTCAWAGWEGYKFVARTLARSAEGRAKKRIVVMGFLSETGQKNRSSAIVTERLTSEISSTSGIEVIERNRLEEVLREQKLSAKGVVDPATARKIGHILGADAVVTGSVIDLNDKQVEVNARLVDTQDARIIKAVTKKVDKDWQDEKKSFMDTDFNMNIDLESMPTALLPEGFLANELCTELDQQEKETVRDCADIRAHKVAWELKTGALKVSQLTQNPGSDISDLTLRHFFHARIKDWYRSPQLGPLSSEEEDLLQRNLPLMASFPCH